MNDQDLARWKTWIGRTDKARAVVSPELVRRFHATFDDPIDEPQPDELAPLGIHWCMAPPIERASMLGPDGHPARGQFLPPVDLPRRMWAGGKLTIHDAIRVGDRIRRISTIAGVEAKTGRSGPLCFVTLEHEIHTRRGLALQERQDIVYRAASGGLAEAPEATAVTGARREAFPTGTTLLFRYSALTFNGHRIHYDRDYARDEEGYPDLVVHGPLQATRLMRLASTMLDRPLKRFSFRGLAPLIVGRNAWVNGIGDDRGLALWIEDGEGRQTMAATAQG